MDRGSEQREKGKRGGGGGPIFGDEVISALEILVPPPPGCASVFAICNREEDVSDYCWVPIGCAVFFFGLSGCFFGGWGRVMRSMGYGIGRVCAGVLVRLLMKMDGLSHYGCTCEVDGAEVERIALTLRRIEGLSS
jgi:hypothetical protein